MKMDPQHKLEYNQVEHKAIYGRCKDNFKKAINILLYNNKAKDSPEVVTIKNQLGELEYGEANFKNCEELIADVKNSASNL